MIELYFAVIIIVAFFLGVLFGKIILRPPRVGEIIVTKTPKKDTYNLVVTKPITILDKKKVVTFSVRKETTAYSEADV